MTDSFVRLQPDSTGKLVDTSELTVAAQTVERQRIVVADDADASAFAKISNSTPSSTDYGIAVRTVPGSPAVVVATSTGGNQSILFQHSSLSTGSIVATSGTVVLARTEGAGYGATSIQVLGSWGGQLEVEVSLDGGVTYASASFLETATATVTNAITGNGVFIGNTAAFSHVRLRASTLTSGTALVSIRSDYGVSAVYLSNPLPAGTHLLGSVTASSATVYQGTSPWTVISATSGGSQPVNVITGTIGSLTSGTMYQGTSPWIVQAATSGGSQPVSIGASIVNVQAATSGGAQPVAQSTTPWLVQGATSGGNAPVTLGSATVSVLVAATSGLIQLVIHATSGGNQPVSVGASIVNVQAATSGGRQPIDLVASQGTTFAGPYLPVMSAQSVNSWNKNSSPAAGAIAVVNSSAQAAGVRNVCRSITVSIMPSSSAAPALAAPQVFSLFDGTSTTTILWTFRCVIPASTAVYGANQTGIVQYFPELHIVGTAATQMTLGTSATAATLLATVSMQGYTLTT